MIYTSPARIIHLDDHILFRNGLSSSCIWPFFTNAELIEFANGDEAYEFIKTEIKANKKIDLIITDINHPGLKGDELVKGIRLYEELSNSSIRIPILIISMVGEKNFPELRENKIVFDYLSKATEVESIVNCLEEILYPT
jgi:two-component system chemotaxis response regulator CheV